MPVHVSSDVWAALGNLEEESEPLIVVLDSALPLAQAMAAAERAWDAIWYDPTSLLPYHSAIAATEVGPAAWFDDRIEARDSTLHQWAEELGAAGIVDGELRVFQRRQPRVYKQRAPSMIEARFAVPASPVEPDHPGHRGQWSVDKGLRSDLVSRAVSWCYGLASDDEQSYVDVRSIRSAVSRENAVEVFDVAARISGQTPGEPARFVVESTSGRFRVAVFELAFGYVSAADGASSASSFDPEGSLAAVQQAMIAFAPSATRGFAKLTSWWSDVGADTLDKWDPPSSAWDRGVEETALPDAFGMALIPTADLARIIPLGPEWQVIDLGTRTLVEHSDHISWYGDLKPDPATLQRAREQLRNIIRASIPGGQTT